MPCLASAIGGHQCVLHSSQCNRWSPVGLASAIGGRSPRNRRLSLELRYLVFEEVPFVGVQLLSIVDKQNRTIGICGESAEIEINNNNIDEGK